MKSRIKRNIRKIIERIVRNTSGEVSGVQIGFFDGDDDRSGEEGFDADDRIKKTVDEYLKELWRPQRLLLLWPFPTIALIPWSVFSWRAYSSLLKLVGAATIFYYAVKGMGLVVDQSITQFDENSFSADHMRALVKRNVSQGYGALLTFVGLLIGFLLDIGNLL